MVLYPMHHLHCVNYDKFMNRYIIQYLQNETTAPLIDYLLELFNFYEGSHVMYLSSPYR